MTDTDARIQAEREAKHAEWLADIQKRRDAMYGTDEPVVPDPTMGRRMEEAPRDGTPIRVTDIYEANKDEFGTWTVRYHKGAFRCDDYQWPDSELACWWPLAALKVPDWAKGEA